MYVVVGCVSCVTRVPMQDKLHIHCFLGKLNSTETHLTLPENKTILQLLLLLQARWNIEQNVFFPFGSWCMVLQ